MTAPGGESTVLHYSLAEFAYILLFLSIGVLALVYVRYTTAREENAELQSTVTELEDEVAFLNEILAEKENAIVPCWRRPDGVIPELVGTVTIRSPGMLELEHAESGELRRLETPPEERGEILTAELLRLFQDERVYAEVKNCYIRMRIVNETNDFSLFKEAAEVLKRIGVVLVNE